MLRWDEPFEVWSDASNRAIGAVLQQHGHPVAFLSRKFNSAEKNYSVFDKELLAVINALKHWKHFLYGRDFTVRTDHQALRWLQSMPSANWSDRQARWSHYFEQFGDVIEYILGIANPVVDALSRKSRVSHLERQSFLSIEGIGLEDMKNNCASSD